MHLITINHRLKTKNIYNKTIYWPARKIMNQGFYLCNASKETNVTVDSAPLYTFPTSMITVL